jgi:sugar lactone lactonase YvrE
MQRKLREFPHLFPSDFRGAVFNSATDCKVDAEGNFYILEGKDGAVRKISKDGIVSTITRFDYFLFGLALNGTDNLLVSIWDSPVFVRNVNIQSGNVTVAIGNSSSTLKEGPALEVGIREPCGLAYDELGNLFFLQRFENAIYILNATNNLVSKFAGGFNSPRQIVFDSQGRLIVTDQYNHAIKIINW